MKLTSLLFSLILLSALPPLLSAQGPEGEPPPPPHHQPRPEKQFRPGHPLLRILDSDEFTEEEQARLRKLSIDNPPEFAKEMRKVFRIRRQTKAKNMLALRQAYLDAKTPELKDAARKKIQETMIDIKKRFGKNAVLKGTNLSEGATGKDRNNQIGGHKA